MNIERGFRRITWVLSLLLFVLGIALVGLDVSRSFGGRNLTSWDRMTYFVVLVGLPVTPWALFYVIRWLVRGFKGHSSGAAQGKATTRSLDTWIKKCVALGIVLVAVSIAYYIAIYLPREQTARMEMERQERLTNEQRERAKLEIQRQADEAVDERLSREHVWPIVKYAVPTGDGRSSNVNASLATSWRDGRLYYRLTVAGAGAVAHNRTSNLLVDLLDSGGFKVTEIYVPLEGAALLWEPFITNESIPFSRTDYLKVDGWHLWWK